MPFSPWKLLCSACSDNGTGSNRTRPDTPSFPLSPLSSNHKKKPAGRPPPSRLNITVAIFHDCHHSLIPSISSSTIFISFGIPHLSYTRMVYPRILSNILLNALFGFSCTISSATSRAIFLHTGLLSCNRFIQPAKWS